MRKALGLSKRRLANDLNIPEATLRTYLDYARAFQLRDGCAANTTAADIEALSVKQVRQSLRLPEGKRDAWLHGGAVLARAKTQTEQAGDADGGEEGGNERANATTDDEENVNSTQEGEQRGQEQHEADDAEASAARKGKEHAGTKDYATDNFEDVLQGLKTARSTLARYEEPLQGLLETLGLKEKKRTTKLLAPNGVSPLEREQ